MRKFENARMVLFDSTNAAFRLAVEVQTVRTNPQGQTDLAYITNKNTAILNPNIYLTFTYKTDGIPATVYTSYPQLFRLREALETVKDLVATKAGYVEKDGLIAVRPDCSEPVVVDNIGKSNNWISFRLVVLESGENGVITKIPGVSLELSASNGFASCLTIEEFLTIYTIVKDLDLSSIQAMVSLSFLSADSNQGNVPLNYYQPQAQVAPQPYMGMGQGYAPNTQGYYQPNGAAGAQQPMRQGAAPRYTNNPYRGNGVRQASPSQPQPYTTVVNNQQPGVPQSTPQSPAASVVNNQQPLPARDNKPIMTLDSVEDTPVSNITFDDSDVIDEIFSE